MQKRIGTANGCADCLKRKTVTTPNDLNKPQDSGNWTEEMTGTDKWMEKNRKEDWGMDVVAPVAQGAVLLNPIISVINDVKVLTSDEDMYGNEATGVDKAVSAVDIATLGVANKLIKTSQSVYKFVAGLNFMGQLYTIPNTIYQCAK